MGEGYGYSIWAVPVNSEQLREKYLMSHIPHVTLKTNMEHPPQVNPYGPTCEIDFDSEFVLFPNIYGKNDLLRSSGFFCNVSGLKEPVWHAPHMTIWYNYYGAHGIFKPPRSCEANICIVNTMSSEPSEWFIMD